MEVLTILVMIVAVLSAAITNAIVQRRQFASGRGWVRSTVVSGFMDFVAAIGIIATYFIIGHLIWKLAQQPLCPRALTFKMDHFPGQANIKAAEKLANKLTRSDRCPAVRS
ncbi:MULTISPECIES: hypothetical protein [Sphingobium]|uniref:Fructose-specific phosphotransferase system IIC component n=1 Tax=Sphingobium lignivorans TaxID=2735886 RepID=A0ABR6NCT2_9SPHN|nr:MULTISPECIES: hypothetical protein [Sphingobium]MBB5985064.1 fructose-specific phosphotransferase system IIC component [Sphingobium lignivorans]